MIDPAPTEFEIALQTVRAPEPCEVDDDERKIQHEAVLRLFQNLTNKPGDPDALGKRVMLQAFIIGASPFITQRELAEWAGVSEARISVAVKLLRRKWGRTIGG